MDSSQCPLANGQAVLARGMYGATGRNRTADLLITNQLLYRLSYSGLKGGDYRGAMRMRPAPGGMLRTASTTGRAGA